MMKHFTLLPDHITLLRHAVVVDPRFSNCPSPVIDPKRPYGSSDVLKSMAKILEWPLERDEWDSEIILKSQATMLEELHRELSTALQIVLRTGTFKPGSYIADYPHDNWRLEDNQ